MMRTLVRRALSVMSVLGLVAVALAPADASYAATVQVAPVSASDSPATIIAKAADVVPAPRQLAWQRLEQYNFLHFGINTFTGREWGTGTEDPNAFQPHRSQHRPVGRLDQERRVQGGHPHRQAPRRFSALPLQVQQLRRGVVLLVRPTG
ncbi:hypothetical protein [Sphaerisporangium rhizosphaerae]|uniref:Uncharacterized protein n=1 Tax=Sphaerisporangium rhizosphaerae TaxID=2269375 RepID=A0ABW2P643_9ACTN